MKIKRIRNKAWLITGIISSQCMLIANLLIGTLKPYDQYEWTDIFGESGGTILLFSWLWVLLSSRPSGRVSNFLISGLLLLFLSSLQDTFDEFIKIPLNFNWLSNLESIFLVTGMILLTVGLFIWHKEQEIVSKQLSRREKFFRDHRVIDDVTKLADIRYLKQQLQLFAEHSRQNQQPFSLLLVDIDDFHKINRNFGFDEGDRLLQITAELLILNVTNGDLICRYAGDRFAILLENTNRDNAELLLKDCLTILNHYTFRTKLGERAKLQVSGGIACYRNESEDELLERAKVSLLKAKEQRSNTTNEAA